MFGALLQNADKFQGALFDIINGAKLIAKGISWLVYLPLKLLQPELPAFLIQLIYLAVLYWVFKRITDSSMASLVLVAVLSAVGLVGGVE